VWQLAVLYDGIVTASIVDSCTEGKTLEVPRKWTERIGRRLKLSDLHLFITVVEMGSMGKAAERLAISQPSVSKAIADLEHTIGVRLLDRAVTGVAPTAYGLALVKRSMGAFDELRQGIKDLESLADPTVGEVRIGCPEAIASGLLVKVLDQFSSQYPHVKVRVLTADNMLQELWQVRERQVDLLLGSVTKLFAEEDLEAEVLYNDRPFIVSGSNNRWARRRKVELEELLGEPWLLPGDGFFLAEAFQSQGLAVPKFGVTSYSVYQRILLLTTGRFIGLLSSSVLRFSPAEHFSLRVLPVDFFRLTWPIAIVTLKNRTISPVVQTFIDCIRDVTRPLKEGP
jgi:DNA-binding transcriptional LysR family regulator